MKFLPFGTERITIAEIEVDMRKRVLHESVLGFSQEISLRRHNKVDQGIITNIGKVEVYQSLPGFNRIIETGETVISGNFSHRDWHCLGLEEEKIDGSGKKELGLIHVIEVSKPEYIKVPVLQFNCS